MTDQRRHRIDAVLDRRQPDLTVLAENLHKPRNFSAVIRTADAVGVHEVNVVPGDAPLRRHWRTASGTEKWMLRRIHTDIRSACKDLKSRGFRLDPAIRARLRFEWLHPRLAEFCRQRDLPYPELDQAGELVGAIPRG